MCVRALVCRYVLCRCVCMRVLPGGRGAVVSFLTASVIVSLHVPPSPPIQAVLPGGPDAVSSFLTAAAVSEFTHLFSRQSRLPPVGLHELMHAAAWPLDTVSTPAAAAGSALCSSGTGGVGGGAGADAGCGPSGAGPGVRDGSVGGIGAFGSSSAGAAGVGRGAGGHPAGGAGAAGKSTRSRGRLLEGMYLGLLRYLLLQWVGAGGAVCTSGCCGTCCCSG